MCLKSPLDGLRLVEIPAGQFIMGSLEGENVRHGFEFPPHKVHFRRSFYMSATPITQGQFEAVMGYNPSQFFGQLEHPVENLSWHQAAAFCNALSKIRGLPHLFQLAGEGAEVLVTGIAQQNAAAGAFRLPTEEEWEYACRAGTMARYWWGDEENGINEHAWWRSNSAGQSQRVDAVGHQNPWGLWDMLGNVWEWCLNPWRKNYRNASSENDHWSTAMQYLCHDLTARSRPWRGGSWYCANPRDLRCSFRVNGDPLLCSGSLGFRVVHY